MAGRRNQARETDTTVAGRTPWPNVAGREKSTSIVAAVAHSRTVTKTEGQRRQAALPRQGINPDVTTEAGHGEHAHFRRSEMTYLNPRFDL